jgi:hypothetical protein
VGSGIPHPGIVAGKPYVDPKDGAEKQAVVVGSHKIPNPSTGPLNALTGSNTFNSKGGQETEGYAKHTVAKTSDLRPAPAFAGQRIGQPGMSQVKQAVREFSSLDIMTELADLNC